MVDNCYSVAVFCICSAILSVLLKQYNRENAMFVSLAACTGVLFGTVTLGAPMLAEIADIFGQAGISDSYISLIFKAAAICFIAQMTSDICRDSGETAIASAAELWGRAAVTFLSLPLVRVLLELIQEMM